MVGSGRADVRDRVFAREIMMTQALARTGRGLAAVLFLMLGACGQPAKAQAFKDFSDNVTLYVRDGQTDHASIVLYDPVGADENHASQNPIVAFTLTFGETAKTWDYRAAIDDKLAEFLKDAPARLVGTHTEPQQGERTYLLVTPEPAKVIAALRVIAPPAGIEATAKELPASSLAQWAPTPLEFQASSDDNVRRALEKQGDDGSKPRSVEFFFYKGDQVGLRAAAVAAGFTARKTDSDPNGSILSLTTPVDAATLDTLNTRFLDWSDRFKAEYDGWEAEVVKK
jgi:hypothetical protein